MNYELKVTETGNKAAKFHYQVIDESGAVISERKSNREYVACTANGSYYFGRLNLVGQGDHGVHIKIAQGYGRNSRTFKLEPGLGTENPTRLAALTAIAYKK